MSKIDEVRSEMAAAMKAGRILSANAISAYPSRKNSLLKCLMNPLSNTLWVLIRQQPKTRAGL